jgi:hypothetical protein
MASYMIKVAGEGAITKAHRTADVGPTSGSSVVYEILNVPEGVSIEDVIEAFRGYKTQEKAGQSHFRFGRGLWRDMRPSIPPA